MNNVIVAMATDLNYLYQTCLAIESAMMQSDSEDRYKFYVLMKRDVWEFSCVNFTMIQKKYNNCTIEKIFMDDLLPQTNIHIEHISEPTYYRMLLPQLIREDKCLYLDSDVIVCKNLAHFYNISLEEYELAGVIAPSWQKLGEKEWEYMEQTGIPSFKTYVNAGVLLLNLAKMREENFVSKAVRLIGRFFPGQDQDIINLLAYGKIKLLPLCYNAMVACFDWQKERLEGIFTENEIHEAKLAPYVIHFSNKYKPWEYMDIAYADRWWRICRYSLMYEQFLKEYQDCFFYYAVVTHGKLWKCDKFTREWLEEIKKYSKIYIYGAGIKGKRAVNYFTENEIIIEAVLVSDDSKNGTEVCGIQVVKLSSDVDDKGLFIVAASEKYHIQIRRSLFKEKCYNVLMLGEI